jgi:hypothetical protein
MEKQKLHAMGGSTPAKPRVSHKFIAKIYISAIHIELFLSLFDTIHTCIQAEMWRLLGPVSL